MVFLGELGINGVSALPNYFLSSQSFKESTVIVSPSSLMSLPATVSRLSEILAELDTVFRERHFPSEEYREYAPQFQDAASRLVSFSTAVLRDEVMSACRNALSPHRKKYSRLSGDEMEDAVQEATLRLLMRMRNLAETPIRDLPGYAFMTLGRVLAATVRRKARTPISCSTFSCDLEEVSGSEEDSTFDIPESREVEGFLENHPHSSIFGVNLADVYRAMVASCGKRRIAAESLHLTLGQFGKLWSAVVSLITAHFSSALCA
jgi:hypothetical protein